MQSIICSKLCIGCQYTTAKFKVLLLLYKFLKPGDLKDHLVLYTVERLPQSSPEALPTLPAYYQIHSISMRTKAFSMAATSTFGALFLLKSDRHLQS